MVSPRIAVYSAIFGEYNTPKKIPDSLECHAYMFTESWDTARLARDAGWCPLVADSPYLDEGHHAADYGNPAIVVPMLSHKWYKTHPIASLPEFDISIWIDGSMEIVAEDFVEKCLEALGEDDWAMMRHPSRSCIYPEAEYSATLTFRYDAPSIEAQAAHYKAFYPANRGLIATGFNVRRHTPEVAELGELWWHEVLNWSHQDQISLPVLLWIKEELKWNTNLPWHEWLIHHPHG